MPESLQDISVNLKNFSRGYSPKAFFPGEAFRFSNLRLDRTNNVVPRPGATAMTSDLGSLCQGINRLSDTWIFIIDGKIFHATHGTYPLTTGSAVYTGGNATRIIPSFAWGSYIIIIGLAAAPLTDNGSAVAALGGSPPNATWGCMFGDICFLCSNTSNRIYFSATGDLTTWPAANWIDVGASGEYVNGLCQCGDALYIFKNSEMWQLTGRTSATFYLRKLIANMGVESNFEGTMYPMAETTMIFTSKNQMYKRYMGGLDNFSPQVSNAITPSSVGIHGGGSGGVSSITY